MILWRMGQSDSYLGVSIISLPRSPGQISWRRHMLSLAWAHGQASPHCPRSRDHIRDVADSWDWEQD